MPAQFYEKDEILDACLAVFAQYGYEKTSVVMLAKAAGISRTLIFHHFKSKRGLYLEIVDRIAEKAGEMIDLKFLAQSSDFFRAREELSRLKFRFSKNNPMYYRVIKEIMSKPPAEIRGELQARFGEKLKMHEKQWENLFAKTPLKEGVDRKQAYAFVQMVLEYFDDKYFSELTEVSELDETFFQSFLDERNNFLDMLRYGIQNKKEGDHV